MAVSGRLQNGGRQTHTVRSQHNTHTHTHTEHIPYSRWNLHVIYIVAYSKLDPSQRLYLPYIHVHYVCAVQLTQRTMNKEDNVMRHFHARYVSKVLITYRTAGNFRGRKTSRIGKRDHFADKTFAEC